MEALVRSLDDLILEEQAQQDENGAGADEEHVEESAKLRVLRLAILDKLSHIDELRSTPAGEKAFQAVLAGFRMRQATRDQLKKLKVELPRRAGAVQRQTQLTADAMRTLAQRTRARRHAPDNKGGLEFEPDAEPVFSPAAGTNLFSPTPVEHHDVLVVAPAGVHAPEEFFRFPVVKKVAPTSGKAAPERLGQYSDAPELMDHYDYGQRKVVSLARPQDWGSADARATDRGPAFATLPVKPEPAATAFAVCYLLNTQNMNYRNAWTAEEWNDIPGGPDLPPARSASANELEALIAGPRGKVFRLVLRNLADWTGGVTARLVVDAEAKASSAPPEDLGCVESVDLRPHVEVWQQLRTGTVMGRVLFDDANGRRVVPLVNITTLTRD
jgi:hypothetical protein